MNNVVIEDELRELLPMAPREGPPLPKLLKLRWPKFLKEWRERGDRELERFAREITRDIKTPFR